MRTFTFHVIAGLLAIGLMFAVNSAQAQHGTQSKLVVTSISLSPTAASVAVGKTLQFNVTAGFNNGSTKIVTTSATWSSSDSKIASIGSAGQSNPGLAAGVAPGSVNITASFSGVSAVTTLNVTGTGATLSSFFISQVNPTIAAGAKLQLFGYAEFSDGSTNWVTSTTNWTSSNPSIAAIQNQGQAAPGLVTAAAGTGTTTVTANFEGITPSTTVRVAANAVPIALTNMTASQNYLNFQGGLYENSSDTVPADHDAAGKAAAAAIQPLDQNGNPSATGAVVFLGIGMSNATEEFSAFQAAAVANTAVNHKTLAIEDGASGAATACYWTVAKGQTGAACPAAMGVLLDNQYDRVRDTILAAATKSPSAPAGCGGPPNLIPCLTEKQVQVLWIKNANPRPGIANERTLCDATVSGCVNDSGTEAILYESQLGQIIRAAKLRYPNLKQVFLSTRIYAGYATQGLSPEPYAYEYGYSAKWLIEAQVLQERTGTVDPVAGNMSYTSGSAAWTAWGTYLWANGTIANSNGTTWLASDFQSDGTHPDAQGATKVVNLLMGFYTTSPYTPWFRP
jgi:Bacterial Ig-like domain (group 2)